LRKHCRQIERIEPDHWAGALVAVLVPEQRRGQDQIAPFHWHFLTVDDREATLSLDHKPYGAWRVPVIGRGLAGQDQL
jgi:hypothetical protein